MAIERRALAAIEDIDPDELDPQRRLSWEIFRRDRQEVLDGLRFPDHLLPLNQIFSIPVFFVQLASPGQITPFESADDYEEFARRMEGFAVWTDQAVANLREGVDRGVLLPRVVVHRTLPALDSQIVEDPSRSAFAAALESFPDEVTSADRQRIRRRYRQVIGERVIPAYRRLRDHLRDEYLPHARTSVGWSALPDGKAWYAHLVRVHANTDLTPEEIHAIGQREVRRIRGAMRGLAEELGLGGGPTAALDWARSQPGTQYRSEEDLLRRYRSLRARVEPHLPEVFEDLPAADFEIRPVEAYRRASTPGAHYMPSSPDGSRPGIFYVNTGHWRFRNHVGAEALFLHEALPGHHFQMALARELEDIPRFRRFNQFTAYVEGWGLYAESLGERLGLYRDPVQRLGQLSSELFRAQRLVVDTGLHALGWSRDEALRVLPNPVEIDRYIAMPGQALAYKMGELEIRELRGRAEERLGEAFDLRAFHSLILGAGPMPLDVLETRVDSWIGVRMQEGR